jgi:hypothetical protein
MVQKYISMCLVLLLVGLTTPAFAGDYVNARLLPQKLPLPALATLPPPASMESNLALHSGLALATPQSGQTQLDPNQATGARSGNGELTGKGVAFKWLGVGLMVGGGALIARGATISNPCNGYGPGVLCTSNYAQVRAVSIGLGAALAGTGALLFARHNHYRE